MASSDIFNESFSKTMQLACASVLPMALKAAIELDVLEIMAAAGPGATLSAKEIASKVGTQNPDAPAMLERILGLLACYNVVTCASSEAGDQEGSVSRVYSLAPGSEFLVRNEDGVSLAPVAVLIHDKVLMEPWYHLKEAVVAGGLPFDIAYRTSAFAYSAKDPRFNQLFNRGMLNHSTLCMNKILQTYKGFQEVKELMDVGGGVGATLRMIISKHPHIKGINFDLPHVIADAPVIPGVKHVVGNMFESIPSTEAIFMKWILHDWSDEPCLKLLKNCYKALPSSGKVIVLETLLPETPKSDATSRCAFLMNMLMLGVTDGGRERSAKQFEALAKQAGFASISVVYSGYGFWVIEFYKEE